MVVLANSLQKTDAPKSEKIKWVECMLNYTQKMRFSFLNNGKRRGNSKWNYCNNIRRKSEARCITMRSVCGSYRTKFYTSSEGKLLRLKHTFFRLTCQTKTAG